MQSDHLSVKLRQVGLAQRCVDHCATMILSVKNGQAWVRRFREIVSAVDAGNAEHRQLDNHLFELQALCYLVGLDKGAVTYEPKGDRPGKNCDVLIDVAGTKIYVELKAFHPTDKSKPIPFEYITPQNVLDMDPILYHQFQATRARLLDLAFDVEAKLDAYTSPKRGVMAVLLGYYLDLEDFRDFVAVYRGAPRSDDPLALISKHQLRDRSYRGTIDEFWGLPFVQLGCGFQPGQAAVKVAPLHDRPILEAS